MNQHCKCYRQYAPTKFNVNSRIDWILKVLSVMNIIMQAIKTLQCTQTLWKPFIRLVI